MNPVEADVVDASATSNSGKRGLWPARRVRTESSASSTIVPREQRKRISAQLFSKVASKIGSIAAPIRHSQAKAEQRPSLALLEEQKPDSSAGTPHNVGSLDYGWRERARCYPHAHICVSPEDQLPSSPEELMKGVKSVLEDSAFRVRPKSGREYWQGFLQKVRRVNSVGAPKVRVVWWRTLYELGRLPRWPDDREHVLDLQELITVWNNKCDKDGGVDGHYMYVRFFSHRWERPHYCDKCHLGTCQGKAHPDTESNIKARVIGAFGCDRYHDELDTRPFRPEDAYFWIDFAGIHQEDAGEKMAGIAALPLYVSCCANGMIIYVGADGTYADRAWTALERVLAYGMTASPGIMKLDEGYLESIPKQDRTALARDEPEYWKLNGDVLHLRLRDPTEGQITVKEDLEHIRKIADLAAAYAPIDFYGVKARLNFGETEVPVEELSRVMHHLVKRKAQGRTVHYGQGALDAGPMRESQSTDSEASRFSPTCCGLFGSKRKNGNASKKPAGDNSLDLVSSGGLTNLFSKGPTGMFKDDVGLEISKKFFVSPSVRRDSEDDEDVLQTTDTQGSAEQKAQKTDESISLLHSSSRIERLTRNLKEDSCDAEPSPTSGQPAEDADVAEKSAPLLTEPSVDRRFFGSGSSVPPHEPPPSSSLSHYGSLLDHTSDGAESKEETPSSVDHSRQGGVAESSSSPASWLKVPGQQSGPSVAATRSQLENKTALATHAQDRSSSLPSRAVAHRRYTPNSSRASSKSSPRNHHSDPIPGAKASSARRKGGPGPSQRDADGRMAHRSNALLENEAPPLCASDREGAESPRGNKTPRRRKVKGAAYKEKGSVNP